MLQYGSWWQPKAAHHVLVIHKLLNDYQERTLLVCMASERDKAWCEEIET